MVGPRVNVGSLSAHVKGMSRNFLGGADDSKTPSLSDLMKNGSKKTGNVFGDDDDESDSSSSSDSDSDSSSSSDSDDDDDDKDKKKKKSKKSKKDTSKASFLSKINGVAAAPVEPVVDKAPLSNGKASKAVKKTAKTTTAATTSSSSSSSSDSESDSSPSKKAAAKTKKAAAKADAESSSSSDSDSSSSSSSSSSSDSESESEAEEEKEEEEEEEKTVAAPAAKNNTSSDSDEDMADQSFAMTARETGKEAVADSASQFTSQGFQLRRAADDADASDVTRIFKQAKLEGKQVWYFTAPASVPVTVIEKMAIPIKQAQKGKPILNHAGQDYGVSFDDNMTSKMIKLFIPNPAGDKYSLLNRDVDQTIHLKRVTQFAQPGGSSGGSGSTSTEVPAVLAPPPVKKTPRPQPAGLRNRFLPMGVNDNNNSAAKKRKASAAVAATADSDDSDDGGAAVKPTTKKARAATTTTTSVPVPSIPGMSTPKVTPVAPPVVPHSAALSSTPVVPPTPVVAAAAEPKKSKDKKKKTTKAEAAAGDAMEIDGPVVDDKKEEKKEKKDKKEKKEKKEKKDKKEKAKAASQDTPVVKKVTPVPLPHIP